MIKRNRDNIIKLVVSILCIYIFILLWIGIKTGLVYNFDNCISGYMQNIRNEFLTNFFIVITELGGVIGLFSILVITVIVLCRKNKIKEATSITLNLIISTFMYVILKNIFQRERPITNGMLINENGYSFPSGHTTNNVAFYTLAIYLVYRNVKNKIVRNICCVVLSIIPILIAFSRIYLGVHFMTDILGGFCLGILLTVLFISFIYPKIELKIKSDKIF